MNWFWMSFARRSSPHHEAEGSNAEAGLLELAGDPVTLTWNPYSGSYRASVLGHGSG